MAGEAGGRLAICQELTKHLLLKLLLMITPFMGKKYIWSKYNISKRYI